MDDLWTIGGDRKPVIALGVTGSIAAYKSAELVGKLTRAGAEVRVLMTANACRLVAPATFSTLSRHPVVDSLWDTGRWQPEHVELAEQADLLAIAPATANIIGKLAHGIADDALSTFALSFDGPAFPKERKELCITATQEDVDFLIAFEDDQGITHLIMIEAKGDTSFSNKQLEHKAERLRAIFGDDGLKWDNIRPHFVLCSPERPKLLNSDTVPTFMLSENDGGFVWFRLYMPANQRKVTRCEQGGTASHKGTHWKIENVRCLPN